MGPRRPNRTSSPYPTTTGGTTRGTWINPSTSDLPGKLRRARNQAMAMPNGRLPATLKKATRRLRRIASHSMSVSCSARADQGEASGQENLACLRPFEKREEITRQRAVMTGDQCHRIDNGWVGRFGKGCCNANLAADQRVGRINY